MQIIERRVGDVTLLDLHGSLTIAEGAEGLVDRIRSLAEQQRTSVVLNLAGVRYVDSEGLGQLVACYRSLATTAGGLKLMHIGPRTRQLLSITKLLTIFAVFDSEDDAVSAFHTEREKSCCIPTAC